MTHDGWMIYGAYGHTGEMIAHEAVRQGRRPLLAGRSGAKLRPLAERLGLQSIAVDLTDEHHLLDAVGSVQLVLHCAGPYSHTIAPMLDACLRKGVHYLDISGELASYRHAYDRHEEALRRKVAIIPGVGFDVVATDCLCRYVADRLPTATSLHLASRAVTSPSAGTIKTTLEGARLGGKVRRNDELIEYPLGSGARRLLFTNGPTTALPIPASELASAWRTTGIPNITIYTVLPGIPAALLRLISPLLKGVLSSATGWKIAERLVTRLAGGSAMDHSSGSGHLWARVEDDRGASAEAWLETIDPYTYTAVTSNLIVDRVLAERPEGALTPAGAFGANLTLEVPGTKRYDVLPADRPGPPSR
jgi:short subunit dehydrogenase-like uncharacterized protein